MKASVRLAMLASAAALVAASCGGGSGATPSASEAAYVQALSKSIANEHAFGGDASNADCLATGIIKAVGLKTLVRSNFLPEDFAKGSNINMSGVGPKKIDAVVDFMLNGQCIDVAGRLADSMVGSAGASMTKDQALCAARKIVKQDSFRRGFRASLMGTSDTASAKEKEAVRGFMTECGVSISGASGA